MQDGAEIQCCEKRDDKNSISKGSECCKDLDILAVLFKTVKSTMTSVRTAVRTVKRTVRRTARIVRRTVRRTVRTVRRTMRRTMRSEEHFVKTSENCKEHCENSNEHCEISKENCEDRKEIMVDRVKAVTFKVPIMVEDMCVKAVIGSGVEITVLSTKVFNGIPAGPSKAESDRSNLVLAERGKRMNCNGTANFYLGQQKFMWIVYVVPIQDDLLIRCDLVGEMSVTEKYKALE